MGLLQDKHDGQTGRIELAIKLLHSIYTYKWAEINKQMKTHKHNYAKISPPPSQPPPSPQPSAESANPTLLRLSRWSMVIYVHEVIIISMIVLILPTYHIAHL